MRQRTATPDGGAQSRANPGLLVVFIGAPHEEAGDIGLPGIREPAGRSLAAFRRLELGYCLSLERM
jgi:hypothetical protein